MPRLRSLKHQIPKIMSPKLQTFLKRLLSTVILIAVLAGVVLWNHPYGYAALICVLCNLASLEWHCMLRGTVCNRWLALVAGVAYPWLAAAISLGIFEDSGLMDAALLMNAGSVTMVLGFAFKYLLVFALVAFIAELVRMDYRGQGAAQALHSVGVTLLAFIFPVWLFSFAFTGLLDYPFNVYLLLWLVLVTKLSDIFAYVCGVLLGRRLIKRSFSPAVSPKKTWEGIIGSLVLTSVSGFLLLEYTVGEMDMPPIGFFIVFMPLLFILSVAGDLAGSLIKRGLGVKDSGSLLPGIGGVFDLIDSPAFTVSFFVVIFSLF